jgi:hypothetical protein
LNTDSVDAFTGKTSITDKNIVLIGDSMLNNSAYVPINQSIPELISKATNKTLYNFAKDGATINDSYAQIEKISTEHNNSKTNIFVSVGGNNILNNKRKMDTVDINNLFNQYTEFIKSIKVRAPNANLYVLTLYFPVDSHYKSLKTSIEQWNKLIEDNTFLKYKVLQPNKILVLDEDFVYSIEPSFKGGQKIVDLIVKS